MTHIFVFSTLDEQNSYRLRSFATPFLSEKMRNNCVCNVTSVWCYHMVFISAEL